MIEHSESKIFKESSFAWISLSKYLSDLTLSAKVATIEMPFRGILK